MINEKAILINVTIHKRTEFRVDKRVSKEVNDIKQVRANTGNYRKRIYHTSTLQNINAAANDVMAWVNKETAEWDGGYRLLPIENLMRFREGYNTRKKVFDDAVETFITRQPEYKHAAQIMLKDMYREDDYPSAAQIREEFQVTAGLAPLPADNTDFRLHLNDADMEAIKADIRADMASRYAKATEDLYKRVKRTMKIFIDKLKDEDKLKRAKSGFLREAQELVEAMPNLNFNDDPRLNELIEDVRKVLKDATLQNLKHDTDKRTKARKDLGKIMEKLEGYGY